MPQIVIGTTPKLLLEHNTKRRSWWLQFLPSTVVAANSGNIFVARGKQPDIVLTEANYDEVGVPGWTTGDNIDKTLATCPFKGQVWMRSDTGDEVCIYEETNEEETIEAKK